VRAAFEYEIDPEPAPDEAAAVIAAVEQALAEDGALEPPRAYRSRWRQLAAREAVDAEP
jgi:hypothetical protein